MSAPVRVLLLWPGTEGAAAGNFGVPQLVGLATYLRERTRAAVDIVDLETERGFGPVSLPRVLGGPDGRGYDVIALGCYSSYDYLKCLAIAGIARALHPEVVLCAGGYHASARPDEIVCDASPFDVCIVGEGERPLARVVESVAGGAPIRGRALGPEPIEDLDELPPTDWSYLARYRSIARRVATQTQIYLSRGCPFDCAFCMERAKREVSWRAFSPERAVIEMERLHAFLGLESWTVYIADALFGMRSAWRKEFLERLIRARIPARKLWLLIRVDLVDDEDLALFGRANCGLGFGLESGDPGQLAVIRKSGRLDEYLERMRRVSDTARELDVPWGANVIVGHPGETEATMRASAAYLRDLFLDPRGTTGFLSVDPFRLYPGSPIDESRAYYESTFGTRFHRPDWWQDGDPEFLSEWVDPSRDLDYRRRARLQAELFAPILAEIPGRFRYAGPAGDYFRRAVDDQIAASRREHRLHYIDRYYAWSRYLGRGSAADAERRADPELALLAREAREAIVAAIEARSAIEPALRSALVEVPRERFVPLDEVRASTRDVAVPLDATGLASVSAVHAYARAFALAGVREGDRVLDLGCGTGYGAAILARLVGPSGQVHGVDVDPELVRRAASLASGSNLSFSAGDALDPAAWGLEAPDRVTVGFALAGVPDAWAEALPEGAVVVAPILHAGTQRLTRLVRRRDRFEIEVLEEVVYVAARTAPPSPAPSRAGRQAARSRRALPVVP